MLGRRTVETIPQTVFETEKQVLNLSPCKSRTRWETEQRNCRWTSLCNMMLADQWQTTSLQFPQRDWERWRSDSGRSFSPGGWNDKLGGLGWTTLYRYSRYRHVVYTDITSMNVNFSVCATHKVALCTYCKLRRCRFTHFWHPIITSYNNLELWYFRLKLNYHSVVCTVLMLLIIKMINLMNSLQTILCHLGRST